MTEAALNSEPIPLGHRQTIRRYFELIRPQGDEAEQSEVKPAPPAPGPVMLDPRGKTPRSRPRRHPGYVPLGDGPRAPSSFASNRSGDDDGGGKGFPIPRGALEPLERPDEFQCRPESLEPVRRRPIDVGSRRRPGSSRSGCRRGCPHPDPRPVSRADRAG